MNVSSSAFRNQYYQERLAFYESLDLSQVSEPELLAVAGEASSLQKFLTDILEEGYVDAVNRCAPQKMGSTNAKHSINQTDLMILDTKRTGACRVENPHATCDIPTLSSPSREKFDKADRPLPQTSEGF